MVVFQADSVDEWEDVVSGCFIPLNCVSYQSGYRARMEHRALGRGISVSSLWTMGTTVERTERLARRATGDDLHLSLQIGARGTIRQGRRAIPVHPGSVSVYATDTPYHQDYSEPGQKQLIVQLSRASLGLTESELRAALDLLRITPGPASRDFFSYVGGTSRRAGVLGGDLHPTRTSAVIDLAQTMIRSSLVGGRVVPRTTDGMLHAIDGFVSRNLARTSVADIAREFHVSRRGLYDLFAHGETTPGDFIRGRRLDEAAARLADPTDLDSVADIAAHCGFLDATTFTRAFRRRYGLTPREWRRVGGAAPHD